MDPIRRAAVAGSWYPGTPAAIAAEVEGYLAAARPPAVPGRLVGLISPHAGLRYSGGVAAYARGAFETRLGRVPVAEDIAGALLAAGPALCDDPEMHRKEHSLEMQLPFLQHVVPDLRLVPLLMGSQSREEADALAGALARVLAGRDVLLVASSDLSHYQPAPVANRLDAEVAECVGRFDPEGLMDRLERRHDHACGGGPMVAVMKAARSLGADRATVLRYGDSGDVGEGDKSRVVGYLSAALSA